MPSVPAGVTGPPALTFFFGDANASSGAELSDANVADFAATIESGGCGPFGVWESGNGGEVATEIELRLRTRLGVFAMSEGVVVRIQGSQGPMEVGEVEGVWVRYGERTLIKYVHVKDPAVQQGDAVVAGQRLGQTTTMDADSFFWETELRHQDGDAVYALAWNTLLTNRQLFDGLYGQGSCTAGPALDTDGSTPATTSNWKNDRLTDGRWDVTATSDPCDYR